VVLLVVLVVLVLVVLLLVLLVLLVVVLLSRLFVLLVSNLLLLSLHLPLRSRALYERSALVLPRRCETKRFTKLAVLLQGQDDILLAQTTRAPRGRVCLLQQPTQSHECCDRERLVIRSSTLASSFAALALSLTRTLRSFALAPTFILTLHLLYPLPRYRTALLFAYRTALLLASARNLELCPRPLPIIVRVAALEQSLEQHPRSVLLVDVRR
jgi:hypothetical protein